jgi:histidinol dehydrogenase
LKKWLFKYYFMQTYLYPKEWFRLTQRPNTKKSQLNELIDKVFNDVRKNGDRAIKKYSLAFDKVKLTTLQVSEQKIKEAAKQVSPELKKAIQLAKNNIEKFHTSQKEPIKKIETTKGVICWRESRPIEKVGIYIPGGTAPLFSTVLMLGIPARLAGCKEIILCTPSNKNGEVNPVVLYTANLLGIRSVFSAGGIQAIAAMSLGTKSITQVDKIFGPGNQYVTAAKQKAQSMGIAIDMPAGPSEVLVIADQSSNPSFVAADLLSQAEHGTDSQVILLSDNEKLVENVLKEIKLQLNKLPRKSIATKALKNSKAIVLKNLNECMMFSNMYAPEHLILATKNANRLTQQIQHAGSVFLGNYSCESAGDYASGTNHTLPTNGFAKAYSGVSLDSFIKKITFQELSKEGIQNIGPSIELMAEAEELFAHKNAVTLRLNKK